MPDLSTTNRPPTTDYDAVVVGAGPNGLAAAIRLRQHGLSVLLLEAGATVGGGMRTAELTLPGFRHDIGSAVHPLGADSPFFKTLPLDQYGLRFIDPPIPAAHPFADGSAACLLRSVDATAETLGPDAGAYRQLMQPLLRHWPTLAADLLGPLRWPQNPLLFAQFGLKALLPATTLANRVFRTEHARGLWAGMAAHAIQPLSGLATSSVALVLSLVGHARGWPMPAGGAQAIADALLGYYLAIGGQVQLRTTITSLRQLPSWRALLFDTTPRHLLQLGGHRWSWLYERQLRRFRYGMGVYKIDWALAEPVPFRHKAVQQAGTVHLGGSLETIAAAERETARGGHPERPFVLLAQPSRFDAGRAPAGRHTLWAYCHVPNGSRRNMTDAIEGQLERFAPGFRDRILARHTMDTAALEAYCPNYVGGDINSGAQRIDQIFTRPALRLSPYRTSTRGIYLCSSATPPGGGVHGMGGYWAANRALRDMFRMEPTR